MSGDSEDDDDNFDFSSWERPAIQGDVAGIALYSRSAIINITRALQKLADKSEVDIGDEMEAINGALDKLQEIFVEFTGFSKNER